MRVRFGDFVLDRATRQLWKISKQEVQTGLWPDTLRRYCARVSCGYRFPEHS